MKFKTSLIGELIFSLDSKDFSLIEAYLVSKLTNANLKLINLFQIILDLKAKNRLAEISFNAFKVEVLKELAISDSLFGVYINKLCHYVKEMKIYTLTQEKNIYSEILWGEYLIEKKLTKNLHAKLTNYNEDQFIDPYSLLSNYAFDREQALQGYSDASSKTASKQMITAINEVTSLENFYLSRKIETLLGIVTFAKQFNISLPDSYLDECKLMIQTSNNSNKEALIINSLLLSIAIQDKYRSYRKLKDFFLTNYFRISKDFIRTIYPSLLNFCQRRVLKGVSIYSKEQFEIFKYLLDKKVFFNEEFFTDIRFLTMLGLEIKFGDLNYAEKLLNKYYKMLPISKQNSFLLYHKAKISFAKLKYSDSIYQMSNVNTNDTNYLYQLYKILLLKNYAMLEDDLKIKQEKDNFYRYMKKNKSINNESIARNSLFLKLIGYMMSTQYKSMSYYLKKQTAELLVAKSEFFPEKDWMIERFLFLAKRRLDTKIVQILMK